MVIGERNWLLREPKARFVTPFPSLPRSLSVVSGSKPLLINCYDSREQRLLAGYAEAHKQSRRFIVVKEGLGRIVEVSPQKGMLFAGRPEEGGWREGLATTRAKGSLRDAFPFAAAGLPANFSTRVAWLFEPLFCL